MYDSNSMGDGVVASDMHVGAEWSQDLTCPPGSPPGRPVAFGANITGIAAGATTTLNLTVARACKMRCCSLPPLQAPNFTVTGLKIGDIENILQAGATVTGSGAVGPLGVDGTEFLPYAQCGSLISGQCVQLGEPVVVVATNTSGVAAKLNISFMATTIPRNPNG